MTVYLCDYEVRIDDRRFHGILFCADRRVVHDLWHDVDCNNKVRVWKMKLTHFGGQCAILQEDDTLKLDRTFCSCIEGRGYVLHFAIVVTRHLDVRSNHFPASHVKFVASHTLLDWAHSTKILNIHWETLYLTFAQGLISTIVVMRAALPSMYKLSFLWSVCGFSIPSW